MKKLFFYLLLTISLSAQAQDKAPMQVSVVDFQNNIIQGEQVLFVSKETKEEHKGITGTDGQFKLELPGGQSYEIKVKSIGSAQDYSEIAIPALGPNERYGTYTLTVQYEMPKTFTLENLHFDTGKSSIRASSYKELNELAELLSLKRNLKATIDGHTDNVGSDESNLTLSQARADAVRSYLVKKGIDGGRLTSKGYGESKPVASNDTMEGRQQNRRTEVHFAE